MVTVLKSASLTESNTQTFLLKRMIFGKSNPFLAMLKTELKLYTKPLSTWVKAIKHACIQDCMFYYCSIHIPFYSLYWPTCSRQVLQMMKLCMFPKFQIGHQV